MLNDGVGGYLTFYPRMKVVLEQAYCRLFYKSF